MSLERWRRIQEIFHASLERDPTLRDSFLTAACEGDAVLRSEVESLLASHDGAADLIEVSESGARAPEEFKGTPRFQVLGRLGSGAYGVVYRVHDQKRNALLALKALRDPQAEQIYRFKREFRTLTGISHPNLVSLHELQFDAGHWFFTMDLVDGVDFLEYVTGSRGAPDERFDEEAGHDAPTEEARLGVREAPVDMERLRAALGQLAQGVYALHRAGRLHRDLKPSNVLVTRDGRVRILDFGLVTSLEAAEEQRSVILLGTPAYMAPELGTEDPVTEASDWYAVGVMLYEALTGKRPFSGRLLEVLEKKRSREAAAPSNLATGIPEDLEALCLDLLRRDPAERPTGAQVLARLAAVEEAPARDAPPEVGSVFVGREQHLATLGQAFATVLQGRAAIVQVRGRSGIGKTALVHHFLGELNHRGERDLVMLTGRCYERESVPYKALDSVVDALSQYLAGLSPHRADALLPRDLLALSRLFPVLRQAPAVDGARRRTMDVPDAQELRRRGFEALRDLLGRVGERCTLVVFIDDLQWGDPDSAALLRQLLRPPDPPRLLLIACYRSEDVGTSPSLQAMTSSLATAENVHEIVVEELSRDETRVLARSLVGGTSASDALTESIAEESGGSPFFVDELARHVLAGRGGEPQSLEQVIGTHVAALPEGARHLLEIIAMAGHPVAREIAEAAARLAGETATALDDLRTERLVRMVALSDEEAVDVFHDRIREAIVAGLSPDARRRHQLALGHAVEASGGGDPEALAVLFQGGGETAKAAAYAERAAERAAEALAFDRAARLFRTALELRPGTPDDAAGLRVKLADALANSGRGPEAARAYQEAALREPRMRAIELQRRAAEQLLRSGHIDEGLAAIREVLAAVGMKLARTPRRALISLWLRRAQIRLGGLRFRERDARRLSPEELIRIDTCWSVAVGLGFVDTLRGADFQARHLLLATRAGEPYRVARALALEVGYAASAGGRGHRRAEALADRAMALAERTGHPHALALVTLASGVACSMAGRRKKAVELCDRAEAILRAQCTGVAWELATALNTSLSALAWMGELGTLARRLPLLLEEARTQGNLYSETQGRLWTSCILWLAADLPDKARREVHDVMEAWSRQGFHTQHLWGLLTEGQVALYSADASAWELMAGRWDGLVRSLVLRTEHSRIAAHSLRARAALSAASVARDPEPFLLEAERDARRMERDATAWGNALARLHRAGVAATRGLSAEAVSRLAAAETACESAELGLYAASARRRRGEMIGGDEGRGLVAAADAWMAGQNIRAPERMAAVFAPGRWS